MTKEKLQEILELHKKWMDCEEGGLRANLSGAYLSEAYLRRANLCGANLSGAYLSEANLCGAYLSEANLSEANLCGANLRGANLYEANLSGADLCGANLSEANLYGANLCGANLSEANLSGANLSGANLSGAEGLVKIVGAENLNYYYKKINSNFQCNNYYFQVGLNKLRIDEVFAEDERVLCSFPGFHFASKSWCEVNYSERTYLAKIQIPKNAKINEPWATDGKVSADMIKIIQVWDINGNDVTEEFKNRTDGRGNLKESSL